MPDDPDRPKELLGSRYSFCFSPSRAEIRRSPRSPDTPRPMKNPLKSDKDHLDTLHAQGLLATVKAIEPFDHFI